jgi:cell division protein ZapA (FtsZ GTPase activity inhibitor)
MDDKFSIKINIADRPYPVKIIRTDEEKIRKAAKFINDKIQLLKEKKYSNKDDQDFLAMVSLQLSTRLIELEEKNNIDPIIRRVKELDEKLKEYLDKE